MPQIKNISRDEYTCITLKEIKDYLTIDEDNTSQDEMLRRMYFSAIDLIEKRCNIRLASCTIDCFFEDWEIDDNEILLPIAPFSSIVGVYYIDSQGVESTASYSKYGLNIVTVKLQSYIEGDKVRVRYICGYGINDSTEDVQKTYDELILSQIMDWYEHRPDWTPVLSTKIKRLLNEVTYRTWI